MLITNFLYFFTEYSIVGFYFTKKLLKINNMYNSLGFIILQAAGGEQNPWMSALPLVLIVVVFYFFIIRPQSKKQKEIRKYRESIKVGDKVLTIGGIHGKIAELDETTAIIEVENKMRLKIERSAIAQGVTDMVQSK